MNTTTTDNTDARSTGRMTSRSIVTPIRKATTIVAPNATQYGIPALIIDQAIYVQNIASSPCAKFTRCVAW